ncbi:hypothetical protein [Oceanibaculum indicum]|uniref:Uncharacterized protein n=1 Tax=Oceanibaculum indicum TaxID=526216 RepID=A0A420WR26_9PROT|nr:hypothetical protein [Oceanibaculum indicum]RKQ73484.1 hypothetical protein BCL74_1273 [Oceanibaculum indicum]
MAFNRQNRLDETQEEREARNERARQLAKRNAPLAPSRFAVRQAARQRIATESREPAPRPDWAIVREEAARQHSEAAMLTEAQNLRQHQEEEEEAAPTAADQAQLDRAAQIADLCAKHGVPEKASGFILDDIEPAEVERLIGRASAITALVEQAHKIDARLDVGMARELIASGASIKEARRAVINEMADIADTVMIRNQVEPGTTGPTPEQEAARRWERAMRRAGIAIRPATAQQEGVLP